MCLRCVRRTLRSQFREIAAVLWPEDRAERARAKAEHLHAALRRRLDRLVGERSVIDAWQDRLERERKLAARLASRIDRALLAGDRASASQHACDLGQAEEAVARCEAQLRNRQQSYQERLAEVAQIKRRLAQVRERAAGPAFLFSC